MTLRPFWRYYGGKWRAAPRYPKPLHDTIIEPFAGAAGYSLRYPERKVILVEKYAVIAEIWRYLIGVSAAEVLRIPLVQSIEDLPTWVPQGARHLVGFCFGSSDWCPRRTLSAGIRKNQAAGRYAIGGWSEDQRARVAAQVDSIRHWQIIEGDYTRAPAVPATWFIDPPYQVAGVYYRRAPSTKINFGNLAAWCRSRPGQVIACEADGATWLPFRVFGPPRTTAINRSTSREAIWTSGRETQLKLFEAD